MIFNFFKWMFRIIINCICNTILRTINGPGAIVVIYIKFIKLIKFYIKHSCT